jgi:hypothetical protein
MLVLLIVLSIDLGYNGGIWEDDNEHEDEDDLA